MTLLGNAINKLEEGVNEKEKFLSTDMAFHVAIANAANLSKVGKIVKVIHCEVNRLLSVLIITTKQEAVSVSIQTAKMVYDFIVSGKGNQAARGMRNQLSTYVNALKEAAQKSAKFQPAGAEKQSW